MRCVFSTAEAKEQLTGGLAAERYEKFGSISGRAIWGRDLVRNFHALGVLKTVCDADTASSSAIATQYSEVDTCARFQEVLDDPSISAVAISTPAAMHGPMVREALLADKDVYVEKPLCLSERDAEALVALAQTRDRILMVGHLLWYHPAVLKLKELISDGTLGRVQYVYSNRLNMGKLRREEHVLWSFAPHDVSIVLDLLGEEPIRVQASGGNFLHRQIADTTVSLLEFASGVRAHIFVSWLHPFKEQKLVVVGERKMAVFDDTAPWDSKLTMYAHSVGWEGGVPIARKASAESVKLEESEPLRDECAHFLDCVANRTTPRTDGTEGLRVLRVLNACQAAPESATSVPLVKTGQEFFAHDTAVIEPNAKIGNETKIWHLSVRRKITRSISHLGMRDRWYSSTRRGTSVVRCSRVRARDRRFADPWDKCPHRYGS